MTEVTRLRTIAVTAYGPTALSSVGLGAVTPVLALTALRVGADAGGAAVVVALLGVGMVAGDLPAGAFAARFGERWTLIGASLLEAIAFAAAGLTSSVPALAAAVFAAGLAQSAFGLARHSYLAEVVPPRLRARALSALGGVHRVGMLLGPFVGAAAAARWGLSGAYAVAAVAGVGAALLVLSIRDLESPARQTGGLAAPDAPFRYLRHSGHVALLPGRLAHGPVRPSSGGRAVDARARGRAAARAAGRVLLVVGRGRERARDR